MLILIWYFVSIYGFIIMDDKRYNLLNEMHTHWKGLLEYLSKSYNNDVGCINIKSNSKLICVDLVLINEKVSCEEIMKFILGLQMQLNFLFLN